MHPVEVYVRYSSNNVVLDKLDTLTVQGNLVFRDETRSLRALAGTTAKFATITAASPLIGLARIVRSVAFTCSGNFKRAGHEFVGGLSVPVVAATCLVGSTLSWGAYLIDRKNISLNVQMKRTYAYFEAWVNNIDLYSANVPSFSQRVSSPTDFIGKEGIHRHVWTTAPCMQPILEKGFSEKGGLLDVERMQRIFPLIPVLGIIRKTLDKIEVQSQYQDGYSHVVLCDGACEHARSAVTCCCCRIETAYDRVLCFQVGQGNCISTINHNDSCGFVFCSAGCVGVCCCTENNNLVAATTCLVI